jgi:membrane protease YdiL (CAAX protease family)
VTKVFGSAIVIIVPLIAAAWLPPTFPLLLRQIFLCAWGVGATLAAERLFFSPTLATAARATGFSAPRPSAVAIATLFSVPMWVFLPLFAWGRGVDVSWQPDRAQLLLGVVLVNGVAEEIIHRGFVFGHMRRRYPFGMAATLSALLFAAQHLYLLATMGWIVGMASVILALALAYPLALSFEHGGRSLAGPAILHTSSNAPMMVFALPDDFRAAALLPHMAVVLGSLSVMFLLYRSSGHDSSRAQDA